LIKLFGSSPGGSSDRSERNQERMPIRDSRISTARGRPITRLYRAYGTR
jgi:hypothetical protein